MKYTEDNLNNWTKRSSDTEQQKIDNAISMIKDAINNHAELKDKDIEIFAQGSYANNTNVRIESDVDVNIMLKDTFYDKYKEGKTRDDYGFTEGTNNYDDYKREVLKAVQNKFGIDNIIVGNKSFKIGSNTYRVEADVVPSFQYRDYSYDENNDPKNFIEGTKFFDRDDTEVINYPKIHISNGITKNNDTARRYKRLVRIFKRIKYKMIDDGISVSENITSFLLECLIWNLPNSKLNDYDTWTERVKQAIIYLLNKAKSADDCKDWGEVSERFFLFHSGRKWTVSVVNQFLNQLWNYLEYNNE